MKLTDIFRVLKRNFLILIIFPSLLASLVFYKTKNEKKEYSSSFMVYTGIASGYNLNTEEHPRLDHNAVNNAFDNLLTTLTARETIEEVGIRLMVDQLRMDAPDERTVNTQNFNRIRMLMPDTMEARIKNAASQEDAVAIVYHYKQSSGNNAVKALLNSGFEIYGIDHIAAKITATRKAQSDMLQVSYSANDPATCQQTLQLLSEVFVRRYKEIKRGEINNVVTYFDDQTRKSQEKLKEAEDKLKEFEVKNKIINFEEQTKAISEAKQNLIEDIQKEKLVYSAAEATVRNLELKMNMRKGITETNEKILRKRQRLADLNYKIANADMDNSNPAASGKYKAEAENLKEEIRETVNELYKLNNSTEGLPRNDVMMQWLNNVLIQDESSARLKIMESKLAEFDNLYDQYAPLGATINRMKREIEVAEKEYLDQLSALNMNKQRQQNIELSNNVKVVDKPFYPLQPKGSKRMILVAGSFVAGFTMLFAFLLAYAFFDNRVKTPARAEQITGLKLAGAMPAIYRGQNKADVEYLASSLMEQTISTIVLEMRERGASIHGTKFIMVSSTRAEEGKTWCAYKLASKLSEIKGKVMFLYPASVSEEVSGLVEYRLEDEMLDLVEYKTAKDFVNVENPEDLIPKSGIDFSGYSYVMIEIPPLCENQLPVELVKKMDVSLLVLRADRVWTETDNYVSRLYRKACKCDPMLLLNRVSPDGLKEIFGAIPKSKKSKKVPVKLLEVSASSKKSKDQEV